MGKEASRNNKALSDHWKDEHFVAEMKDRYREYKTGKAKLFSLDEASNRAREALKTLCFKKELNTGNKFVKPCLTIEK